MSVAQPQWFALVYWEVSHAEELNATERSVIYAIASQLKALDQPQIIAELTIAKRVGDTTTDGTVRRALNGHNGRPGVVKLNYVVSVNRGFDTTTGRRRANAYCLGSHLMDLLGEPSTRLKEKANGKPPVMVTGGTTGHNDRVYRSIETVGNKKDIQSNKDISTYIPPVIMTGGSQDQPYHQRVERGLITDSIDDKLNGMNQKEYDASLDQRFTQCAAEIKARESSEPIPVTPKPDPAIAREERMRKSAQAIGLSVPSSDMSPNKRASVLRNIQDAKKPKPTTRQELEEAVYGDRDRHLALVPSFQRQARL